MRPSATRITPGSGGRSHIGAEPEPARNAAQSRTAGTAAALAVLAAPAVLVAPAVAAVAAASASEPMVMVIGTPQATRAWGFVLSHQGPGLLFYLPLMPCGTSGRGVTRVQDRVSLISIWPSSITNFWLVLLLSHCHRYTWMPLPRPPVASRHRRLPE